MRITESVHVNVTKFMVFNVACYLELHSAITVYRGCNRLPSKVIYVL